MADAVNMLSHVCISSPLHLSFLLHGVIKFLLNRQKLQTSSNLKHSNLFSIKATIGLFAQHVNTPRLTDLSSCALPCQEFTQM